MKAIPGKRYPKHCKNDVNQKGAMKNQVRLPAKTGNIVDVHFVFRGRKFMLKNVLP